MNGRMSEWKAGGVDKNGRMDYCQPVRGMTRGEKVQKEQREGMRKKKRKVNKRGKGEGRREKGEGRREKGR